MKKLFLFVFCAFMVSTSLSAQQLVPFTVMYDENNQPIGHGNPKTPIQPPIVYIEDYTLSFVADHPAYVLVLKDENGDTVYTTVVHVAQTEVELPSTLSGNYEIRLVLGLWRFTGYIEL